MHLPNPPLIRSEGNLTWHIPTNELWIKLGVDKGHGSFKVQPPALQHQTSKLPEDLVSGGSRVPWNPPFARMPRIHNITQHCMIV